MALTPLTRKQLQELYDVSEVGRQKRVQETIQQIYTSLIGYATKMPDTSYTYQFSKYLSTPQSNDDLVAGLKLIFPDSCITLVDKNNSYVLMIDWSPHGEKLPAGSEV
jgi:hypothetical protein